MAETQAEQLVGPVVKTEMLLKDFYKNFPVPQYSIVRMFPEKSETVPTAARPDKHVPSFHSSYLWRFIEPDNLRESIKLAVRALELWKDDFDAVAFRGMSGALIGPPVALAMNKTMIMVRKPDEDSHAIIDRVLVEGDAGARSYIILDDFVSSGKTAYAIKESIKQFAPDAEFLGLLQASSITEEKLEIHRGRKYPLWTSRDW